VNTKEQYHTARINKHQAAGYEPPCHHRANRYQLETCTGGRPREGQQLCRSRADYNDNVQRFTHLADATSQNETSRVTVIADFEQQ